MWRFDDSTKFPIKTLQRLNASRPPLSSGTSQISRTPRPSLPTNSQPRTPSNPLPNTPTSMGGLPHSGSIGNVSGGMRNGNGIR